MHVKVLYFAHARTARGCAQEVLELPDGAEVRDVRRLLEERLGSAVPSFQMARNAGYAAPDDALREGDEIAIIPPVSGGSALLGPDPVDLPALIAVVTGPDQGAICIFLGTVRNEFQGRPTLRLHYEAYPEMAERELQAIADAAEARHHARIALYHRTGTLELEDVSVGIVAASPHRADAFAACREVIEEIKRTVPIWKREIAPDGAQAWHDEA